MMILGAPEVLGIHYAGTKKRRWFPPRGNLDLEYEKMIRMTTKTQVIPDTVSHKSFRLDDKGRQLSSNVFFR